MISTSGPRKILLNLGCGTRFHGDWLNFDLCPASPEVISCDFTKGLPVESGTASAVYHAAVLEHIRREDVPQFMAECFRVLKSGGVLRVGIPDLEQICRLYLQSLEGGIKGISGAAESYDWILLELLDQMVRERSGGQMKAFLQSGDIPHEDFVFSRIGVEGRQLVAECITQQERDKVSASKVTYSARRQLSRVKQLLGSLPSAVREKLQQMVLNERDQRALGIGQFRLSGELHQWMYDRFSLSRLMLNSGFISPVAKNTAESSILGWESYHLDEDSAGKPYKPDLIFVEAIKP